MNMVDVIFAGAYGPGKGCEMNHKLPLPCPWCGESDFGLARKVGDTVIVGCENDECGVNPQACGATAEEAWEKWNTRKGLEKLK
jgi:hypothetical protein